MGIVLSISLTVIFLLEYILPFAKDTKNIEFSSNAFYQSYSATEQAAKLLLDENNSAGQEYSDPLTIWGQNDVAYNIEAAWNTLPPPWEWNSEYDPNWNTISQWNPLQLEIGGDVWNNGTSIRFRVPDVEDGSGLLSNTKPKNQTGWLLSWQLAWENDMLNGVQWYTGFNEDIQWDDFASWILNFELKDSNGLPLTWVDSSDKETFQSFYSSNCSWTDKCTLRFYVINDLILSNWASKLPYLEYQISSSTTDIPLQYAQINASGYSYGFKKDFVSRIPQQQVSEAIGITVFQ